MKSPPVGFDHQRASKQSENTMVKAGGRNINSEATSQFLAAMARRGLQLSALQGLNPDGHFHRCDVAHKDKHGVGDGSYLLRLHPIPHGVINNWTDQKGAESWRYERSGWKPTAAELAEIKSAMKAAKSAHDRERAKLQAEAAIKANRMWNDADAASPNHRYCRDKKVEPTHLRMWRFKDGGNPLLIPLRNHKGKIVNLQFIHTDGRKHGLKGGQASDCHFWIALPSEVGDKVKTIVVCEGWATGETICQATGYAVIMTFGTGNLLSVAKWVHEKYPDHRIIVASDDDWKEDGNPGVSKAHAASREVGGLVAVPEFGDKRGDQDTDFNDLMIAHGVDAVKQAFDNAVAPDELEDAVEEEDDAGEQKKKDKQVDALVLIASGHKVGDDGGDEGPAWSDVYGDDEPLFHFDDDAYADIENKGHRETYKIRSRRFKHWLIKEFYERNTTVPSPMAVGSALDLIEAKAKFTGPERAVHIRAAGHEGRIYLDLCNKDWQCVEIDTEGWRVIDNAPVRFIRRKGMKALPTPIKGHSVEELREFLNVDDKGFVLAVSWLLAALRPHGPYPVLSAQGQPGSAKSTLLAILRQLIDPNTAMLRAPPRENGDVFIAATNAYVPAFDNLSDLPDWLSDTLCRLATGGGFGKRELYSDDEEKLFAATRPVLLGSVENVVIRGDLADRAVFLHLKKIPDDKYRPDKEFWASFERAAPGILGALLDAVAHGLRELPHVKLDRYPRMADFAEWATAFEGAVFKPGAFAAAYTENRATAAGDVVDADIVATTIEQFMKGRKLWRGRVVQLLAKLTSMLDEDRRKSREWPKQTNRLTGKLRRAAGGLREIGIAIEVYRHSVSGRSMVEIEKIRSSGFDPSTPSDPSNFNVFKPLKNHNIEGSKGHEGSNPEDHTIKHRKPSPYPVNALRRGKDIKERAARRKRN
jgi:phage/plasmid primase-like uncharacterized protein